MVNVKLSKREIDDVLHALDYAMEDYDECAKVATTDEEIALYERRGQRAVALFNKLSAAQQKAQ